MNNRPTSSATARQHHRVWTDVTGMPGVGEENVILVWKILNDSLKDTWSYIDKTKEPSWSVITLVKQRRLGHRPLPYREAQTRCQHRPVQQGEGGGRCRKVQNIRCYKMHEGSKDRCCKVQEGEKRCNRCRKVVRSAPDQQGCRGRWLGNQALREPCSCCLHSLHGPRERCFLLIMILSSSLEEMSPCIEPSCACQCPPWGTCPPR